MTKSTIIGTGKYQVIVAYGGKQDIIRSNDQNQLSRIRSASFMDGKGVSVIHAAQ